MERGSILRWVFIGLGVFLLMQFLPKLFGKGGDSGALQPLRPESAELPSERAAERLCDIWTNTYRAQLTTKGAGIKHFELLSAKYRHRQTPIDLSTTPDLELRGLLRVGLRNEAVGNAKDPAWQLKYDSVDWTLVEASGRSCVFSYRDADVELAKKVTAGANPYELSVETTVTNRATEKRRHALVAETSCWRKRAEVEGHMFRVSPFLTHVECLPDSGSATRLRVEDFEPDDFKEPPFAASGLNPGDWYQTPGSAAVAAVSNAYFSQALVPGNSTAKGSPTCQLQIEQRWDITKYRSESDDPNAGAIYRARLAYPAVELEPGQQATYSQLAYAGPKERKVLTAAGGGGTRLIDLIDLGFFSAIAKILVGFLLTVHNVIPNWGVAIILLTLTARTLLFPLAIPSIKSMVKMRELRPEIDALNEKYKDDPQAKGVAQMELWRKHNVNPLKGCLPQLASMPVWFALYTTLQTAVELYNIPFLWFPDLSQPDHFFILPFVIGATSFVQQRMMPAQGDPAQQKMMLYMMPAMFTVFMLFLPAGLGVYMFTNGVLGIIQQQSVEWHVRRTNKAASPTPPTSTSGSEKQARASTGSRSRAPSANRKA